jgi:hypothetical protein
MTALTSSFSQDSPGVSHPTSTLQFPVMKKKIQDSPNSLPVAATRKREIAIIVDSSQSGNDRTKRRRGNIEGSLTYRSRHIGLGVDNGAIAAMDAMDIDISVMRHATASSSQRRTRSSSTPVNSTTNTSSSSSSSQPVNTRSNGSSRSHGSNGSGPSNDPPEQPPNRPTQSNSLPPGVDKSKILCRYVTLPEGYSPLISN